MISVCSPRVFGTAETHLLRVWCVGGSLVRVSAYNAAMPSWSDAASKQPLCFLSNQANNDDASTSRWMPHKRAPSLMAAVPPFLVEAACMARSSRVLSEAGGNDRWRFKRWAMERVRGERAASETGRAIVSGASAMLDMLRRSRRPLLVALGVGLDASVASGPPPGSAVASSGPSPSKSARDERQLLLGRPRATCNSSLALSTGSWCCSISHRQLPPPQRWDPRAQRFEGWTERAFGRV